MSRIVRSGSSPAPGPAARSARSPGSKRVAPEEVPHDRAELPAPLLDPAGEDQRHHVHRGEPGGAGPLPVDDPRDRAVVVGQHVAEPVVAVHHAGRQHAPGRAPRAAVPAPGRARRGPRRRATECRPSVRSSSIGSSTHAASDRVVDRRLGRGGRVCRARIASPACACDEVVAAPWRDLPGVGAVDVGLDQPRLIPAASPEASTWGAQRGASRRAPRRAELDERGPVVPAQAAARRDPSGRTAARRDRASRVDRTTTAPRSGSARARRRAPSPSRQPVRASPRLGAWLRANVGCGSRCSGTRGSQTARSSVSRSAIAISDWASSQATPTPVRP